MATAAAAGNTPAEATFAWEEAAAKAPHGGGGTGSATGARVPSSTLDDTTGQSAGGATVAADTSLQVEELDGSRENEAAEVGWVWWSDHTEWIHQKAGEILAAYNFFFEHIGLRKGWRTAPFGREEVQAPFLAAAEVVAVVRQRLDQEGTGGLVLRQLEGSAMNFLWGWSPGRPPGASSEAREDFFRGLVFATLSDGRGLVEGLDTETVEYYVCSHPLLTVSGCGLRGEVKGCGEGEDGGEGAKGGDAKEDDAVEGATQADVSGPDGVADAPSIPAPATPNAAAATATAVQ